MPTDQKRTPPKQPPRSKHLTLRPDDGRPGELRFMFEAPQKRLGGALGASVLSHGALVLLWLLFVWLLPEPIR